MIKPLAIPLQTRFATEFKIELLEHETVHWGAASAMIESNSRTNH
jgi:hypothetical protein